VAQSPDPRPAPATRDDRLDAVEKKLDRILDALGNDRREGRGGAARRTPTAKPVGEEPLGVIEPPSPQGRAFYGAAPVDRPRSTEDHIADMERRLIDLERRIGAMERRLSQADRPGTAGRPLFAPGAPSALAPGGPAAAPAPAAPGRPSADAFGSRDAREP
jgi:hypothetical protein